MDNIALVCMAMLGCIASFFLGVLVPRKVTSELDLTGVPVQVNIECKHNTESLDSLA